jgi:hypothetical protein
MAENFDLIFGQNASQQYAWNDTDYQSGWETIGNIPPTATQFDALQRRADMKAQELNSRLVVVEQSIAGGGGQKREADTTYAVGDVVTYDGLPMDWVLICIVGGTSGSADITLPSQRVEGARILDGTVTWAMSKIATYGGIGYRQSSTSYYTGAIAFSTALPTGWYLECTGTGGITSASDLVITSPSIGDTITDGTVVWTIRAVASTDDIPAPVDISSKANTNLDNLDTANLACHVVVDSYYNATTGDWYRVYDDGWTEQGGYYAGTESYGSYSISYLKPFADNKYFLQCSGYVSAAGWGTSTESAAHRDISAACGLVLEKTATGATLSNKVNDSGWYACGMGVTA